MRLSFLLAAGVFVSACTSTGPGAATQDDAIEGHSSIYPTHASCATPRPRDCSYYADCVERTIPCGPDGYALGFGRAYCESFQSAPLGPGGKAWMEGVMLCLQDALVPEVLAKDDFTTSPAAPSVCSDLFETAFGSHPACYTRPESSICFLPPSDILVVLDVIGAREFFQARTQAQISATLRTCVSQIADHLFHHASDERERARDPSAGIDLEAQARFFSDLLARRDAERPQP